MIFNIIFYTNCTANLNTLRVVFVLCSSGATEMHYSLTQVNKNIQANLSRLNGSWPPSNSGFSHSSLIGSLLATEEGPIASTFIEEHKALK